MDKKALRAAVRAQKRAMTEQQIDEKSAALGKAAQKRFGKPSEAELERIAWEIESKSGKRSFFE